MTRYVYVSLLSLLFGSFCLSNAEADLMFTTIDVPGSTSTYAIGINDAGQIVGFYADGTRDHGFLNTGGSFTPIDVPGSRTNQTFGINTAGQIVGVYADGTGTQHGFVATTQPVPEPDPSTLLLLAMGFVGLLTTYYRHRQQAA